MTERVVFVFLDGVGLGPGGADNPFSALNLPAFEQLAGGQRWTAEAAPVREARHVFVPIDATLGVDGLPQSGTGQSALFTGEDAVRLHGRHFGPYPPTAVRPTVAARSVFARLVAGGVAPDRLAFANAYPDRFFDAVEARGRWTTTTLAAHSAGVRLRRAADLARGEALPADLTGETWARLLDPDHEPTTEAEAARRLARLARRHAFTLSEYFLTDKAGHSRDPDRAAAVLRSLDRFFDTLLGALGPADLLVVTSDHGNLEDLGTKTHTRHPVPLVAWGDGAGAFADARSLLDVTPRVVALLAGGAA
ncbi:peptidase [Rubrivirga litoralis]|uniref:Peptidase n=1 Tax=Rubrivirga litoralis TaxID=3075598 RepID=A0ABU3BN03_9BACT|nr:peptidase [Rubrivirga sp. F394]MDT0630640.1 peptidase [Rubrivirga sp. F394]